MRNVLLPGGMLTKALLRISLRSLLLPWFITHCAAAIAQISSPPPTILHIAVQVDGLDGTPWQDLKAKNFILRQGTSLLPVTVDQPEIRKLQPGSQSAPGPARIPAHVVLIVSPDSGFDRSSLTALLLKNLPAAFTDYELSVDSYWAKQTPYASSRDALVTFIKAAQRARAPSVSSLHALARYPSRRALIYFGRPGSRAPGGLLFRARKIGATVYQVRGDSYQNYTSASATGLNDRPRSYALLEIDGIHAERNLRNAIHDVALDGEGYYDLSLPCPNTQPPLQLSLKLSGYFRVAALPFMLNHGAVPQVVLANQ